MTTDPLVRAQALCQLLHEFCARLVAALRQNNRSARQALHWGTATATDLFLIRWHLEAGAPVDPHWETVLRVAAIRLPDYEADVFGQGTL